MKQLIFLLSAVSAGLVVNAQEISEKDVPTLVKTALNTKYPNASRLKWEMEAQNYEANFKWASTEYSVLLNASGTIVETEKEIKPELLPAAARDYLIKQYRGQKIREVTSITDSNGVLTYEVELKDKDLIFDRKGVFIKTISE